MCEVSRRPPRGRPLAPFPGAPTAPRRRVGQPQRAAQLWWAGGVGVCGGVGGWNGMGWDGMGWGYGRAMGVESQGNGKDKRKQGKE